MSKGGENGIRKRVPFFFCAPPHQRPPPLTAAAFALRPVYRRSRGDKTGRALGTGLPCKTTHCRHSLSLYRGGRRPRSQLAAPRRSYAASGAAAFGPTPAAWLEAGASARLTPKKKVPRLVGPCPGALAPGQTPPFFAQFWPLRRPKCAAALPPCPPAPRPPRPLRGAPGSSRSAALSNRLQYVFSVSWCGVGARRSPSPSFGASSAAPPASAAPLRRRASRAGPPRGAVPLIPPPVRAAGRLRGSPVGRGGGAAAQAPPVGRRAPPALGAFGAALFCCGRRLRPVASPNHPPALPSRWEGRGREAYGHRCGGDESLRRQSRRCAVKTAQKYAEAARLCAHVPSFSV